jgi:hypothetical protein
MEKLLSIEKRFSRLNKNKYLKIIEDKLIDFGYECEKKTHRGLIRSVNLETKNENPEYLFIAHYDTGTIIPLWMNWLMKLTGINRQFLMLIVGFGLVIAFTAIEMHFPVIGKIITILFFASMLTILIPNGKNYNDNTSGVITLLNLAKRLKQIQNNKVKFLFVDNEELGILGSSAHKAYMEKNKKIPPNCKVISIDCVGGSEEIPLIIRNGWSGYEPIFKEGLEKEFGLCKSVKIILPASDNYPFIRYGAINISFVKETIIPGGYYIQKIHSRNDKTIDMEKIERLCNALSTQIDNSERLNKKFASTPDFLKEFHLTDKV